MEQAVEYLAKIPAVKDLKLSQDKLLTYSMVLLDFEEQPPPSELNPVGSVATTSITIKSRRETLDGRLRVLSDNQQLKAELTRSRDKIERNRRHVEADSVRLAALSDPSEVGKVAQRRRDVLDMIDTELQVVRTWGVLLRAEGSRAFPPPLSQSKGPTEHSPVPQAHGGTDDAEEHRKKGVALNKEARYDEAIAEFHVALQLVPTLPRGHLGLGAALQGKGDLEGAITQYGTELQAHPEDGDTYNNLGTAYQRKGDVEGAISQYRRALKLKPDEALTHFNLATALSTKGEIDDAIAEYRIAIRLRQDFPEAYFDLGAALKTKGQTAEAAGAFRQFLDLAPDTPANKQWIEQARHTLGEIAEQARRNRRQAEHGMSQ
jgi:tetratricopeptide (TPR) repeat protein